MYEQWWRSVVFVLFEKHPVPKNPSFFFLISKVKEAVCVFNMYQKIMGDTF
jgi:hypothetical protein